MPFSRWFRAFFLVVSIFSASVHQNGNQKFLSFNTGFKVPYRDTGGNF